MEELINNTGFWETINYTLFQKVRLIYSDLLVGPNTSKKVPENFLHGLKAKQKIIIYQLVEDCTDICLLVTDDRIWLTQLETEASLDKIIRHLTVKSRFWYFNWKSSDVLIYDYWTLKVMKRLNCNIAILHHNITISHYHNIKILILILWYVCTSQIVRLPPKGLCGAVVSRCQPQAGSLELAGRRPVYVLVSYHLQNCIRMHWKHSEQLLRL